MKPLILIGGGGHCQSVIEVAESTGRAVQGILDIPEEVGKDVLGYPIIGTDDQIVNYIDTCEFLITVGFIKDPALRMKLFNRVCEAGGTLATLIASTAYVSRHAFLGKGTVVMHHAFVNAGARIGENVIINTFCNIEHGACIGDQCHISTGTMVNGDCKIGNDCFIGSQSVLANGVCICNDTVVGAGSLVRKNIIRPGIYSGNPAILKIAKK
mgnify:CR=1 FL=1